MVARIGIAAIGARCDAVQRGFNVGFGALQNNFLIARLYYFDVRELGGVKAQNQVAVAGADRDTQLVGFMAFDQSVIKIWIGQCDLGANAINLPNRCTFTNAARVHIQCAVVSPINSGLVIGRKNFDFED